MVCSRKLKLLMVLLVVLSIGCPATTLKPGEDPILVESQRVYKLTLNTADFLFTTEDQNEAVIETIAPGTHAIVEGLRVQARQWLPVLLNAIDAYEKGKTDKTKGDLMIAQAIVESILVNLQKVVATLPRGAK